MPPFPRLSRLRTTEYQYFQDFSAPLRALTVEVHFVVSSSSTGKGGFDLKIITLGGEKAYKEEQVHKITLTLKSASPEADLGLGGLEIEPSGRRPRRD